MEIKALIDRQKEFDSLHRGNFPWDQLVSAENPVMLEYLALALCGESGEVANAVKKVIRGDHTYQEQKEEIIGEVTDVLIYILKFAYQMDFDLEEAFLKKLELNRTKFKPFEHD